MGDLASCLIRSERQQSGGDLSVGRVLRER